MTQHLLINLVKIVVIENIQSQKVTRISILILIKGFLF